MFRPELYQPARPTEPVRDFWGTGHTLETDPTKNGWKVRKEGPAWLVGQRRQTGCASIISLSGGKLDIALYSEDPKKVQEYLKGGEFCEAGFLTLKEAPGVGLDIIEIIKALRKEMSL